jgi:hypothetical protein
MGKLMAQKKYFILKEKFLPIVIVIVSIVMIVTDHTNHRPIRKRKNEY